MQNPNSHNPYKRPRTMEQPLDYNSQALISPFNAQNYCNYEQDGYPGTMEQQIDYNYQPLMCFNDCNYVQDGRDYFNSFPPGYRFCPTDEELVIHYLYPKVLKQQLPRNMIPEVKLYGDSPVTLTARHEKCGEKDWYFFTARDKKYPNGKRPKRSAGDGYWKATGADKVIEMEINEEAKKIGRKKTLVYYTGKPPNGTKTNWIMHEFRVHEDVDVQKTITLPPNADPMLLDEVVLCRIYNKTSNENDSSGTNDDDSEIPSDPPVVSQPMVSTDSSGTNNDSEIPSAPPAVIQPGTQVVSTDSSGTNNHSEMPSAPPAVIRPGTPVVSTDPPAVGQLEPAAAPAAAEYLNYCGHHCSNESPNDVCLQCLLDPPVGFVDINSLLYDPIFPHDPNRK